MEPRQTSLGNDFCKIEQRTHCKPCQSRSCQPHYLSSYIEQIGTGTTDIIDHCLEYYLRKPEFHQDDDFRAVIWKRRRCDCGSTRKRTRRKFVLFFYCVTNTRQLQQLLKHLYSIFFQLASIQQISILL